MLANFDEGNSVNPVFLRGFYSYLCTIFIAGFGIDIGLTTFDCMVAGLTVFFCISGFIKELITN